MTDYQAIVVPDDSGSKQDATVRYLFHFCAATSISSWSTESVKGGRRWIPDDWEHSFDRMVRLLALH